MPQLDVTSLQRAGRGSRVAGRFELRFRVPVIGRFDAALVPIPPASSTDRQWLLVIEEQLPLVDQIGMYAHALGHLLLNREAEQLGQLPPLDARDGYTHTDILGELRQVETVRRPIDRRVLDAFPLLTDLLGVREESPLVFDAANSDLRQQLARAGWRGSLLQSPYVFTDGRVQIVGATVRRRPKLRVDALLRADASLPIAAVQTVRAGENREDAERLLVEYAGSRLAVPFAYLLDHDGAIYEWDWSATVEPMRITRNTFPSRDELLTRWTTALGLRDEAAQQALLNPYQLSRGTPRYYQEAAINRAVVAALQAKRGLHSPRILLTLATGTGKTKIAFQIVWKLKRARAIRYVLFLTDRDWLLSQAMDNEFSPFGDARLRIQGEVATSRDVVFATYQAIAGDEYREGLYAKYAPNFFDLIVVDECHRGSAGDESNWRSILEHFSSAIQLGLTATPLRTDNVQTYGYFGTPVYTYSLRTGINDGFLAPYRVRRILMGSVAQTPADVQDVEGKKNEESQVATDVGGASAADTSETAGTLVERTEVIAHHLAEYLRKTGTLAKTIVFCVDQAHAGQMRDALRLELADEVARYPHYAERIVAAEGMEGKRFLSKFSTPDERTPVVVTTSKLLTTGVDVPTCKNIVLAKPITSMVEFKQIIGRGTRLYEPAKTSFTILDYAGATQLFFDPDFDGDPEVVELEPLVPQPPAVQAANDAAADSSSVSDSNESIALDTPADSGESAPYPERDLGGGDTAAASFGAIASASNEAEHGSIEADGGTELMPEAEPSTGEAIPVDTKPAVEPQPSQVEPGDSPIELPIPSSAAADDQPEADPANDGVAPTAADPDAAPAPIPAAPDDAAGGAEIPASGGRVIKVVAEIMYELGPDGRTLRAMSYKDYTRETINDIVTNPADLRARWLRAEQRAEIIARLQEAGVDLAVLAQSLRLTEVDPLDVLLYVAFGQTALTRRDRVDQVRRERADFFARYGESARQILDTILQKYINGDIQDVNDTELLKIPPLSNEGSFLELVGRFGGGAQTRAALRELQTLLYSA